MDPKVAIYVRVSTDSQNHESQEAELREYCQRRGWQNVEWYRDTASGARQDRQGLADLMTKIRKGKVDVLLCYKLDRLGRSLSHLAQILAELQSCRVALICPSQGIDTTNDNPAAHLQLNILASVASYEKHLISERVNAGVKAAQARGVKFGRPARSQERRQQILALAAEGLKAKAISDKLRIPYSSVTETLRNE